MGDTNLDFLKWKKTDLPPNDTSLKVKPLTDILFERIIPHGVSQLVTKPTRVSPTG